MRSMCGTDAGSLEVNYQSFSRGPDPSAQDPRVRLPILSTLSTEPWTLHHEHSTVNPFRGCRVPLSLIIQQLRQACHKFDELGSGRPLWMNCMDDGQYFG